MTNERFILTVTGKDHPGIVAGISEVLCNFGCNIQEISQTVLGDEFAMILLLEPSKEINIDQLNDSLSARCAELNVTHNLRKTTQPQVLTSYDRSIETGKDRSIITVIGADKIGIVAGVTKVLADLNINIIDLSAKPYVLNDTPVYSMIIIVELQSDTDLQRLKDALDKCAERLSVSIDIQNQEIFRAMHEI